MAIDAGVPSDHRTLLGLRPPADLAEVAVAPRTMPDNRHLASPPDAPARPNYPIISSGREDEDTGPASKTSDLVTALRAGAVLLAVIVVLGMMIR